MNAREFALQVTRKLQSAGYQALWAGGCVRDQLLERPPKDYDVATDANPDQIRQLFGMGRTLAIGAAFGVITVIGPKSAGNIEIATFRRDADYSDGRRPDSVQFSTAEMDAQRRDFTINGLFFDPVSETVIDYVGGQADLERRVIRAIGNPAERIAEDKLRMLRAVRFASTLEFQLDPSTIETIQKHADEIHVVSPERISIELQKMLLNKNRRQAVTCLLDTGLLAQILPECQRMLKDSELTNQVFDRLHRLKQPNFSVALAILVEQAIPEPDDFEALCIRLKQSNEVKQCGKWILKHQHDLLRAEQSAWSKVQPLLVRPHVESLLEFLRAKHPGLPAIEFCESRLAWPADQLNPPPLIDGDILRKHSFHPGPQYKQILDRSRQAQLDGQITTTQQALQLAKEIVDRAN